MHIFDHTHIMKCTVTSFEQFWSSYIVVFQLQEYIEGLMEVQGKVDNRGDLECHSYVLFPKDQADRFG